MALDRAMMRMRYYLACILWVTLCGCLAPVDANVKSISGKLIIPSGTVLKVALLDPLSTDRSTPGDWFSATLAESVVVEGQTILKAGTKLRGRVYDMQKPNGAVDWATIRLVLTEIIHDDRIIAITTGHYEATGEILDSKRIAIRYKLDARLSFILATSVEI